VCVDAKDRVRVDDDSVGPAAERCADGDTGEQQGKRCADEDSADGPARQQRRRESAAPASQRGC